MEFFVARQPIFDRNLNVFAYELLFRTGLSDLCEVRDADQASSDVLTTSFILVGLDELTSGKKASINFTRKLIVSEVATLFPSQQLLIEVMTDAEGDDEAFEACRQLKRDGYRLVLDDLTSDNLESRLLQIVDIAKIDFLKVPPEEQQGILTRDSLRDIALLAKKVETSSDFNRARKLGYEYFQGFFFSKPVVSSNLVIPGSKLIYLRILNEVTKPEADFKKIEEVIKQDISLSYKLLRFINSAYFGLFEQIHSIGHALALLGIREVKKWVSLTALSGLAKDKPEELAVNSLIRASLCEQMASEIGLAEKSSEFFLMGLFSLIDAIMDKPMSEILSRLPLPEEIKVALLGGSNLFRDVYDTVVAYETGEWEEFATCASRLGVSEDDVPKLYHGSVKWVNQVLQLAQPVASGSGPPRG
jgi:EAL and modified HD-GYP domain-containing signal transduction protein